MSQGFPSFASPGGAQPQGQHNGQYHHIGTTANGRLPANGNGQIAGVSAPQVAVAQTAGIDLTQFPPALVAQVLQAIQMGAIPMPPPPPSQTTPIHVAAPAQGVEDVQVARATSAPGGQGPMPGKSANGYPMHGQDDKDVNMEKEDGEVEDAEAEQPGTSPALLNSASGLHALGRTPRNESGVKTHDLNGRKDTSSSSPSSSLSRSTIETQSSEFVHELHKAGYTFADLAKELGDVRPLRRIYQQLGLRIPAERTDAVQSPPTDAGARKSSLTKRSAPAKATAPSDRTEYLKRLAAARNKAPAKVAATSPPLLPPVEPSIPSPVAPARPNASTPAQAGPSSKKPVPKIDEATAAAKRLLLKERLEALKAKQAAKLNSAQNAAIGSVAGSTTTNGDAIALSIPSRPIDRDVGTATTSFVGDNRETATPGPTSIIPSQHQPTIPLQIATPSPVSLHAPFRGLPGLQAGRLPGLPGLSTPASASPMANPGRDSVPSRSTMLASSISGAPVSSSTEVPSASLDTLVGAKRAAGVDFEMPTGSSRRPFGGSRHNSSTEQFIIHASDDDEDDDADDANHQVPAMSDSESGHLSQIEANVQKLKDKIAAIELAKSSRSTPVGMSYMAGKGNGVVVNSLSNNDVAVSQDAFTSTVHGSKELLQRTAADKKHAYPLSSTEIASEQHHTNPPALSHPQPLPDHQFDAAQEEASPGKSSGSEDFYATDERFVTSPTLNDSLALGTEAAMGNSNNLAEDSPPFDGTPHKTSNPEEESGDDSPHQSSVEMAAEDTASNASSSQDSSSPEELDHESDKIPRPNLVHEGMGENVTDHLSNSTHLELQDRSVNATRDVEDASIEDSDESSIASSRGSPDVDEKEYQPANLPPQHLTASISPASFTNVSDSSTHTEADLAPELRPPPSETATTFKQEPKTYFKPYVSHLAGFKDFRYHPDFLKVVPGGYKSLMYSNKIDPDLAFCPRESVGEECDDPSCQWQHFNAASLNDNEVLMSLGMARPPVENDEENKRWKEGLGTLIKQLRLSKMGSDVNVIAAHICDYRRKFLGDDSKIVHLGS